jgi:hypothetical protein
MSNTITSNPAVATKSAAHTTYELMSVVERICFWSVAFTAGYIGYYVLFKTILDLVGIFATTV